MTIKVIPASHLISVLKGNPRPVILLGAGASVSSGIPLADKIVSKAAKWGYCKENGRSPDDPRVMRSDWHPWLKSKEWYNENLQPTENYPHVIENILQPAQNRKEFFKDLLSPGIPPSKGYIALAEIINNGYVDTILTTNFDELLEQAKIINKRPHYINVIKTHADYINLTTSPSSPQIVYLHGSVDHYTDKNILNEVDRLDESLVDRLIPILRDHPLIVIGYRGGERSVMDHLLTSNAVNKLDKFKYGVYWCILKGAGIGELSQLVQGFSAQIGNNFQLIEIDDFDQLLTSELLPSLSEISLTQKNKTHILTDQIAPFDMKPFNGCEIQSLDWPLLRDRLVSYCNALDLKIPESKNDEWWFNLLEQLHLAIRNEKNVFIATVAGWLLFSDDKNLPKTKIILRGPSQWINSTLWEDEKSDDKVDGDYAEIVISGNLWRQLEKIDNTLSLVNKSFRIKGVTSENVRPYPPLALKEIVVNALVHRDYEKQNDVEIVVEPDRICVYNTGGLVDNVMVAASDEGIENLIRRKKGGIKGYRNPVLADMFYSAGKMDKKGSGLSDVCDWVKDNAGTVTFGPDEKNEKFSVTLLSRADIVNQITDIVSPQNISTSRFIVNMLELKSYPDKIWHVETSAYKNRQIWEDTQAEWLPPFVLSGSRLFTFYNLEENHNVFGRTIDLGTLETMSTNELVSSDEGKNRFVWILNLHLYCHFESVGLIVDKKRKRAYYPADNDSERKISYRGRFKQATRTVVKKRISPVTGKLRYWEHEAFSFNIDSSNGHYNLMINPGYVFTWDGGRGLLAPERVNVLSTKRASRDYNNSVLNDLVFWMKMVSESAENSFLIRDYKGEHNKNTWHSKIEIAADFPFVDVNTLESIENDGYGNTIDTELFEMELEKLADEQREQILEDIPLDDE